MIFKKKSGTYGDCTNSYSIHLDKEYTVDEFINTILKKRPNEWGYIKIPSICKISYSNGNLTDGEFPYEILSKNIKNVDSHGGWSNMDYTIYI